MKTAKLRRNMLDGFQGHDCCQLKIAAGKGILSSREIHGLARQLPRFLDGPDIQHILSSPAQIDVYRGKGQTIGANIERELLNRATAFQVRQHLSKLTWGREHVL